MGIGIPTLVANYIPEGIEVEFQSENGILGMGPFPFEGEEDADLINAGKQTVTLRPGASIFDSATSFAMIRGQHVQLTVLGAMEVAQNGDIANWKIPGKMVKAGESKILKQCTLPLTGVGCVKKVVTDLAVLEIKDNKFHLIERAPGVSVEEIVSKTEGDLVVPDFVPEMNI